LKKAPTFVDAFLLEGDGYPALLEFPTALSGLRKPFAARDFAVQLPLALGCSDEPFDGSHPSFDNEISRVARYEIIYFVNCEI